MSRPRLIRAVTVAAVTILSTLPAGTAASAASADTTPPTAPFIGYAEGFYCLTVIIGATRSTDNVTPQSQLRYEAFDDGVFIGTLTDQGQPPGPWGVLQLGKAGPNTVTVQAIDAAGNRSAFSNADVVTGYYTPGCTPYHF
jgi:hypothetical protein